MFVTNIVPKQLTVHVEMTDDEVAMLHHILSNSEFSYDGKNEFDVNCKNFLESSLYPFMDALLESVRKSVT